MCTASLTGLFFTTACCVTKSWCLCLLVHYLTTCRISKQTPVCLFYRSLWIQCVTKSWVCLVPGLNYYLCVYSFWSMLTDSANTAKQFVNVCVSRQLFPLSIQTKEWQPRFPHLLHFKVSACDCFHEVRIGIVHLTLSSMCLQTSYHCTKQLGLIQLIWVCQAHSSYHQHAQRIQKTHLGGASHVNTLTQIFTESHISSETTFHSKYWPRYQWAISFHIYLNWCLYPQI